MNDFSNNLSSLLDTVVGATLDTVIVPIPEGEYEFTVAPLKAESIKQFVIKKGENAGTKLTRLDLILETSDPVVGEATGRDKSSVRHGIILDLNKMGQLDTGKGKNVSLGRMFDALGLDSATANISDFSGKSVKVVIKHVTDSTDSSITRAEVKSMSRME